MRSPTVHLGTNRAALVRFQSGTAKRTHLSLKRWVSTILDKPWLYLQLFVASDQHVGRIRVMFQLPGIFKFEGPLAYVDWLAGPTDKVFDNNEKEKHSGSIICLLDICQTSHVFLPKARRALGAQIALQQFH
jgi:hypothetical protein